MTEGKCGGFYPPAGPLQAALRLATLIVPMIDFIQSARGSRRLPRLRRRQHDRLLFRRSRDLVARDQAAVLAHQRRRRPAPLLDARGDGRNLGAEL